MKKKGFTLVELIVTITLLAIIGLSIGLSLNKVFNKNKTNDMEKFRSKIKSVADVYMSENSTKLNELQESRGFLLLTLNDLKAAGLIESDIINPETGEKVLGTEKIKVSLDSNGMVKFTYPVDETTEPYLQALNVYLELNEVVTCDTKKTPTDLGLVNIDGTMNTEFTDYECDWNPANNEKSGTYKVTYTYRLEDGRSKSVVRNFIVQKELVVTLKGTNGAASGVWSNKAFKIQANIDRTANIIYSWKKSGSEEVISNIYEVDAVEGDYVYTLTYTVKNINNEEVAYEKSATFNGKLETTIPSAPTIAGNPSGWTNQPVGVTVTTEAVAASGIKSYAYCISSSSASCNGTWATTATKSATVTTLGTKYIFFKGISNAGNDSQISNVVTTNYDNEVPVYKSGSTSGTLNATYTENYSGIATIYYYRGSSSSAPAIGSASWTTSVSTSTPACGSYYYYFTYAKDKANNNSAVKSMGSAYGGACCYSCECYGNCPPVTQPPTQKPTQAPTQKPTQAPTQKPTQAPTQAPTQKPTQAPTQAPTQKPTQAPTQKPTQAPTQKPTTTKASGGGGGGCGPCGCKYCDMYY